MSPIIHTEGSGMEGGHVRQTSLPLREKYRWKNGALVGVEAGGKQRVTTSLQNPAHGERVLQNYKG